jgi:hypothetical protein
MKTHTLKIISFLCLLFSGTCVQAAPEFKQEHMTSAVQALEDAKNADDPLPFLKTARGELSAASKNKGGFRQTAIDLVDEATLAWQGGDKQKSIDKMNAAIAAIHTGMAKAPRKKPGS